MTDTSARNPRRKSIFWRLYLLAWLTLAGGAIGYLAVVAADPEKMAELEQQYLGNNAQQEQVGAQQRAEIERVAVTGELRGLRDDVRVLRGELARLQTKVTEAAKPQSQPKVAAAPVPGISSPAEPPQEDVGNAQQGTVVAAQTAPATPPQNAIEPETARIPEIKPVASQPTNSVNRFAPPLPVRGPTRGQDARQVARSEGSEPPVVLNSGFASSPISTGSVVTPAQATAAVPSKPPPTPPKAATQSAPIKFGAAQITPSISVPKSSAVVVSAAPSLEGLRASWHQLASQHPALLGTLQPRYDAMGVNGPYRLLAGPLSDRSQADRLCSALLAYNVQCGVGDYVGNALLAN
ncbi:MAG: hypothetical protein ACR2OV_03235 [Hyphomicrobiaceae bacterium]